MSHPSILAAASHLISSSFFARSQSRASLQIHPQTPPSPRILAQPLESLLVDPALGRAAASDRDHRSRSSSARAPAPVPWYLLPPVLELAGGLRCRRSISSQQDEHLPRPLSPVLPLLPVPLLRSLTSAHISLSVPILAVAGDRHSRCLSSSPPFGFAPIGLLRDLPFRLESLAAATPSNKIGVEPPAPAVLVDPRPSASEPSSTAPLHRSPTPSSVSPPPSSSWSPAKSLDYLLSRAGQGSGLDRPPTPKTAPPALQSRVKSPASSASRTRRPRVDRSQTPLRPGAAQPSKAGPGTKAQPPAIRTGASFFPSRSSLPEPLH
nr:vegetative cell wall protein gp1 [Aegilops tauschii subsp. strangulata]